MNPLDFISLLYLCIDESKIQIPYSFKISKDGKTNSQRICFIIADIDEKLLLYLISVFNDNQILYQFIKERFLPGKKVGFGFSNKNRKFYIENGSSLEKFTIESYEWTVDSPLLISRNYVNCSAYIPLKELPSEIHQFLNLYNCQYREHEKQFYVQFNVNSDDDLIQELNKECIDSILLSFNKILPGNKNASKELERWLFSLTSLKPAWIQFNSNSFTIYLREF